MISHTWVDKVPHKAPESSEYERSGSGFLFSLSNSGCVAKAKKNNTSVSDYMGSQNRVGRSEFFFFLLIFFSGF